MLEFLGIFFLGLGVVSVFQVLRARKRIHAMVTTETMSSQELRELHQAALGAVGAGAFRRPAEAAGTARPHPSGPLTAQLGQTECVWFRTRVTRKFETRHRDQGEVGSGTWQKSRKTEVVSDFISAAPFLVEDASGSTVIFPAQGIVDHAPKTTDYFETYQHGPRPSGPRGLLEATRNERILGHQHEEWAVQAGTQFFVRGEARDDERGELAIGHPSDGSPFLMAAVSEQQLIAVERNKKGLFEVMAVGGIILGLLAFGARWLFF
ncbi:GIDE domain-containing protein [Streptomyces sp. NPDC048483]|uniref:GIDE domain-containing protein n=1 Tax=Streptomyces sp. NPDC048483 TaxID=3154927 RepID=UPI0034474402